ncbi:MAG: acetolactate synthase small subunit [Mangrovibacterium sp.]
MNQEFIITIFSENNIGLLNRLTINFTRRKINIESLTVSQSALPGISKFIIVVNTTRDKVQRLVGQLEKIVDVLKVYYHTNAEMIFQEIALYKVFAGHLFESDEVEKIIRDSGARILEITKEYVVIEKTGHKEETQELFERLNQFGVPQFVRSGRIAITRDPVERLSEFLRERDALLSQID